MSEDPFATSAGPYVLGALDPPERQAFERHLTGCARCRGAVDALAGLPGLLARVPAGSLPPAEPPGAPPAAAPGAPPAAAPGAPPAAGPRELLPVLLARVRRRRRARRVLGALAAVGLAALLVPPGAREPRPAAGEAFERLVPAPLSATAVVQPVAWGTRVEVTCSYSTGRRAPYALVVTDRAGNHQQIGTWTALPGRDARFTAATSLPAADIAALEVRTLSGTALLRLRPR
ncbi:zf-HC2 domain-containing protein [Kineococcus sp. NUM-3379]